MRAPTYVEVPAAGGDGVYTERGARTGVMFVTYINPPTFHALADWPKQTTRCGQPTWSDANQHIVGTWLPLRWLVRFGRPCARCWP